MIGITINGEDGSNNTVSGNFIGVDTDGVTPSPNEVSGVQISGRANDNLIGSWTLDGDSRFFSADKIEEEKGEYISEVFDGTNDLVKWENISWQVTELFNTSVLMYIRTSTSSNDILTEIGRASCRERV